MEKRRRGPALIISFCASALLPTACAVIFESCALIYSLLLVNRGKLRIVDGHPKPYETKFFELGNGMTLLPQLMLSHLQRSVSMSPHSL